MSDSTALVEVSSIFTARDFCGLVSPLSLESLFRSVASDFEIVLELLEALDLCSELFFAPSRGAVLPLIQSINLAFQLFFFGIPFVFEPGESLISSPLERVVFGAEIPAVAERRDMCNAQRMGAWRSPVETPWLRGTVDFHGHSESGRLEEGHSVLLGHADTTVGIRPSREKTGVQANCWLKLHIVSHRSFHELQAGRHLHIDICIGNDDLFRQWIAEESVKARGVVDVFVCHSEAPGRRFMPRPSGTNR